MTIYSSFLVHIKINSIFHQFSYLNTKKFFVFNFLKISKPHFIPISTLRVQNENQSSQAKRNTISRTIIKKQILNVNFENPFYSVGLIRRSNNRRHKISGEAEKDEEILFKIIEKFYFLLRIDKLRDW